MAMRTNILVERKDKTGVWFSVRQLTAEVGYLLIRVMEDKNYTKKVPDSSLRILRDPTFKICGPWTFSGQQFSEFMRTQMPENTMIPRPYEFHKNLHPDDRITLWSDL
jgi:hypothetical protein